MDAHDVGSRWALTHCLLCCFFPQKHQLTSPLTNLPLASAQLIPNLVMCAAIATWRGTAAPDAASAPAGSGGEPAQPAATWVIPLCMDLVAIRQAYSDRNWSGLKQLCRGTEYDINGLQQLGDAYQPVPRKAGKIDLGSCLPIHQQAALGNTGLVACLVDLAEQDADAPMLKDNTTALHLAARYGHLDTVQWLVRLGHANVEARDAEGNTPLLQARA